MSYKEDKNLQMVNLKPQSFTMAYTLIIPKFDYTEVRIAIFHLMNSRALKAGNPTFEISKYNGEN